ncbi:nascent polypeptide-associated complex protein [Candidatus Woesearchaeota archaeon]|nr:nascent polypeptide-associated complex protein [Candidatus Woesearchaeota archaeon]
MFPGMNPRAVEQAMKKMGIRQVDIPASEVIIKSEGKDIVIANPKVVKVNVMGQDSFQITGNVEERPATVEISEDDVKTVSEQTGVSDEDARKALEESNGDLAAAIMLLKK